MALSNKDLERGFTVIELIIVLVVLSILVTVAVPEVLNARKDTRSLMCGSALKQIEAAKSAWAREFPGAAIPDPTSLNRYFPANMFPEDPWGVGFNDIATLNTPASHDYNGQPAYEPKGYDPIKDDNTNGIADIMENGHNDLGNP
jgi:prepilin-type N-terminal cleavage/methylation domain-containing protein